MPLAAPDALAPAIADGSAARGSVSCLSQFPAEREILFAPLTVRHRQPSSARCAAHRATPPISRHRASRSARRQGLEVASVPIVEEDVIVVKLRLS